MPDDPEDYHDRYVDARDAWNNLHRWLAYHRGATIAADAVIAQMRLLTHDYTQPTPESDL